MLGLGILALLLAMLSLAFAVTYFYSPLAYLAAAVAMPLGVIGRGHERSRALGTIAVVVASVGVVWATVVIVLY